MDECSSLPTFVNIHAVLVFSEIVIHFIAHSYRSPLIYSLLHQNFVTAGRVMKGSMVII